MHLAKLVGELLKLLHGGGLRIELVELLLQVAGSGHVAVLSRVGDLLSHILHRLPMSAGGVAELFLHRRDVFCELGLGLGIELVLTNFFSELFKLLRGLVEVALLHRLREFPGGARREGF